MFSRWIVTNITSARGTVHCRKTRIPCGDQLILMQEFILHNNPSVQWRYSPNRALASSIEVP
jgi:hypothetical protein